MFDDLNKAIKVLKNSDSGWVSRRDAAEFLGKSVAGAVDTLHAHCDDPDKDVNAAVNAALGWASAGLRQVKPTPQGRAYTLQELVGACAREGKRTVNEIDGGFTVVVETEKYRNQTVFVKPHKRRDGVALYRVYTRCGPSNAEMFEWALRNNLNLAHAAFGLAEEDGKNEFVITNSFLAENATPEELKACVKEIAHYGDWLENRLSGEDEL